MIFHKLVLGNFFCLKYFCFSLFVNAEYAAQSFGELATADLTPFLARLQLGRAAGRPVHVVAQPIAANSEIESDSGRVLFTGTKAGLEEPEGPFFNISGGVSFYVILFSREIKSVRHFFSYFICIFSPFFTLPFFIFIFAQSF
jgi:hypothetical protein